MDPKIPEVTVYGRLDISTDPLRKLVKRWRREAGEYQDNVNEARAKGLPHDQMLSMTTALNDCADQLEKLLK